MNAVPFHFTNSMFRGGTLRRGFAPLVLTSVRDHNRDYEASSRYD